MKYFLGADVSKGYCDFIILDENKKVVEKGFQLDDTKESHTKLYIIIEHLLARESSSVIYAAVESTGGYENNWVKSIQRFQFSLNIHIARLNPYGVSHSSKANMERIITDQISARNVAEYLINYQAKVRYLGKDNFSSLRRQWKYISLLKKQKVQLYGQLESLVYISFPEILTFCKNGFPKWVLKLLEKYPTADKTSRVRVKTLSRIPYITKSKAERIISKARNSVASESGYTIEEVIKSIIAQIISLDKTIVYQKKIMTTSVQEKNLPEVELLKSFKGIGDYSAIGLIIEIGFIERFSTSKQLASYFGLHPVFKKSGDGSYAIRMSKKGRTSPRNILFNVAFTAVRDNELIREIYARHLRKGMVRMAAIGAIMHKILRIVYGMLKNNEEYNPDKDRKNVKIIPELNKKKLDKTRRYQDYDVWAPISRRQSRKRTLIKQELEPNVPK